MSARSKALFAVLGVILVCTCVAVGLRAKTESLFSYNDILVNGMQAKTLVQTYNTSYSAVRVTDYEGNINELSYEESAIPLIPNGVYKTEVIPVGDGVRLSFTQVKNKQGLSNNKLNGSNNYRYTVFLIVLGLACGGLFGGRKRIERQ